MNTPHLHLLLNHVPTVGTVIAIAILILSFARKNEGMRRVALELFCVIALLTLPAYLSGVGTQMALEQQNPDVSPLLMATHHDAALFASVLMVLTGGVAWVGLWQTRRLTRPSRATLGAVLLLSIMTFAAMARTATLGGEIRHPEILLDPQAVAEVTEPVAPGWLTAASVAQFVTGRTWVWPASEALHFMGLSLLFGVLALVNIRRLGLLPSIPLPAVHRLLPWAVLGLGINIITGMMFVLGAPTQYLENVSFFWKIGLLLVAGADLLYLTVFDGPWEIREGLPTATLEKALAVTSLAAWIGVMYFGRMLPFIGNAF
jgi:uncharacterized membrane protein